MFSKRFPSFPEKQTCEREEEVICSIQAKDSKGETLFLPLLICFCFFVVVDVVVIVIVVVVIVVVVIVVPSK